MTTEEARLEDRIKERITSDGPIQFKTFMEIVLYDPQQGFYTNLDDVTRAFQTNPARYSPYWGIGMAKLYLELFKCMSTDQLVICEGGAGNGTLARDVLDYLAVVHPDIHRKMMYIIIEISPSLVEKQKRTLSKHLDKVRFILSDVEPFPFASDKPMIFTSNELPDAFPANLVKLECEEPTEDYLKWGSSKVKPLFRADGGIFWESLSELYVDVGQAGNLVMVGKPVMDESVRRYVERWHSEMGEWQFNLLIVNQKMIRWYESLIGSMRAGGFIVTVDDMAPYYGSELYNDFVRTYGAHDGSDNPLVNPGMLDIICPVDLNFLQKIGENRGLRTLNIEQAGILGDKGLVAYMHPEFKNVRRGLGMFSVLIQGKDVELPDLNDGVVSNSY